MSKVKGILALCALMTMSIALIGCSGDKAKDSSEIVVGIPQDLEDSLDPHKALAAGTKEILFNVYEGLLKPDSQGNNIPAVAESYTVSEDLMTYTFKLRDGIKFHNGKNVTADDVKYSIDKFAGISDGSEPLVSAFSVIEEVNIIDDKTVDVVLNTPDTDLPTYLAMVSAAIIPKDNENPDTVAIGTGPYKYVSRSPQENVICEAFDDYWGEKANIKNVTFKVEANADSIVMDLLGGSIDFYARLTIDQVKQLNDEFSVYEGTMNLVQALYLNNNVKPFDDVRVRQALSYATDVDEILDITAEGKGTKIGSSMFPAFGKYYDESLSELYPTDIEKAKELLKEAGYENGFNMTITVPSNYQPHIDVAQVLAEQYKKIGVNAEIQLVEWNSWLSDVYTGRDFESTVIGVDASYLAASALLSRFESTAANNFINFKSDAYDKAYNKTLTTADDDERTALYLECEKILADEAANVYIQDLPEYVVLNKKFTGYEFYPLYVQDIAKLKLAE
ncbi:MAG: ABC transporter substrate-binding protein [Lachnospiraceae bacterium]|jgi:peptide/nickel transport system substrate-binding protein|nr:ABC transporter substrate-binding protein [Lachnospiraceae bacterium]MCI6977017.1 ABC transporter substrate-binding protein [Lachnospiraceae bacterium]MDD7223639.1 ABC transporter substrate-binding protein [Lachnospiraceae bacterium]MDY3255110.1 ABC transporter substrate-binding protein [Lachnospiraceae bacterium]MDY4428928.1 ABC transporter substrate-binding protein [Lachnospiraceae bacterium]